MRLFRETPCAAAPSLPTPHTRSLALFYGFSMVSIRSPCPSARISMKALRSSARAIARRRSGLSNGGLSRFDDQIDALLALLGRCVARRQGSRDGARRRRHGRALMPRPHYTASPRAAGAFQNASLAISSGCGRGNGGNRRCGGWLQNCCAAGRSDRRARAREPSSCQRTPPRVRPAPQSLARIAGTEPPGQRAQPMTRPLRLHARDYEVISRSRILSEQPTLSPALAATPPLVVPRPAPGSAARSADAAMSAPPRFGF